MKDKKHSKNHQAEPAPAAETTPPVAPPSPTPEAALKDQLLRLQADFENFRKRVQRERVESQQQAAAQLITARKHVEQSMLEISEREQHRIGQDLHDGIGQQLAAMRFFSSSLHQKLLERKKVEPSKLERLDHMLAETMKAVRGLARGLYPVITNGHGLMLSLRGLCRTMQPMFGVPCEFECEAPVLVHDSAVALNLYRIAQEAARNAATYGAPKNIRIQLSQKAGLIRLVIKDDGKGMSRVKKPQGMGLEIMRHRAHSIGASLDVHSKPGAGVTITCELAGTE